MNDEMTLGELDELMRKHGARLEYAQHFGVYIAQSDFDDNGTARFSASSPSLSGAVLGLAECIGGDL